MSEEQMNGKKNNRENPGGNAADKREAANRLMDGITDLSDEIILEADQETDDGAERGSDTASKKGTESGSLREREDIERKKPSPAKKKTVWVAIGAIAAAAFLAGLISLGVYLGRKSKEESLTTEQETELPGTEAGLSGTEAGVTEAGLSVTEAGITEALNTETSETKTEFYPPATEADTEAGTERPPTEASVKDNAVHVIGAENRPGVEVKTVSFESLAEMEKYADVILRAVRLDREEPHIEWYVADASSSGVITSGWTFSEVRISEVYKDNTNQLAEGKTITMLENEFYDETSNMVYHISGYDMMVTGYEYLLFLKKNVLEDGTVYYVSCGVNFGTISTADDGRYQNRHYQNAKDGIDLSNYTDIWEEALKKYPEDSQS